MEIKKSMTLAELAAAMKKDIGVEGWGSGDLDVLMLISRRDGLSVASPVCRFRSCI